MGGLPPVSWTEPKSCHEGSMSDQSEYDPSLGSRKPVCERGLPARVDRERDAEQHKSERRLLGQRADGKLFQNAEIKTGGGAEISKPRGGKAVKIRAHHGILQSRAAAFRVGIPEPE